MRHLRRADILGLQAGVAPGGGPAAGAAQPERTRPPGPPVRAADSPYRRRGVTLPKHGQGGTPATPVWPSWNGRAHLGWPGRHGTRSAARAETGHRARRGGQPGVAETQPAPRRAGGVGHHEPPARVATTARRDHMGTCRAPPRGCPAAGNQTTGYVPGGPAAVDPCVPQAAVRGQIRYAPGFQQRRTADGNLAQHQAGTCSARRRRARTNARTTSAGDRVQAVDRTPSVSGRPARQPARRADGWGARALTEQMSWGQVRTPGQAGVPISAAPAPRRLAATAAGTAGVSVPARAMLSAYTAEKMRPATRRAPTAPDRSRTARLLRPAGRMPRGGSGGTEAPVSRAQRGRRPGFAPGRRRPTARLGQLTSDSADPTPRAAAPDRFPVRRPSASGRGAHSGPRSATCSPGRPLPRGAAAALGRPGRTPPSPRQHPVILPGGTTFPRILATSPDGGGPPGSGAGRWRTQRSSQIDRVSARTAGPLRR